MAQLPNDAELSGEIRTKQGNNSWFWQDGKATVLVFLHGVLSDSSKCWLNSRTGTYWPDLVRLDARTANLDIFLAGFYTALDSGAYEIGDAAEEVMRALRRRDSLLRKPVMEYANIVFVAHSLGGVVTRYLLEKHREEFKEKKVGLMLYASPSYGSKWGDKLAFVGTYFAHAMGHQLRWGSWSLEDLDGRFRDLVKEQKIPGLSGIEAVENHFILHWKYLPFFKRTLVVTKESAGMYFGRAQRIPGSDHFSIVKPDSHHHDSHLLLVDFLAENRFML
ncbi:MAG: alpha/beta hydrolase [Methylocystis sp.]|uniref:alpha/beta hydrolase n=1 Tax=Methylocystis sp. TaxID=1911079 RepID=UPI00395109C7